MWKVLHINSGNLGFRDLCNFVTKTFLQKAKVLSDIHLHVNALKHNICRILEKKVLRFLKFGSRIFHCFWEVSILSITFDYLYMSYTQIIPVLHTCIIVKSV